MKAVIPVAGTGTRLRPHTHTAPKVLLNVAGKPILGHIIDQLLSVGVTELTFIVGYLGDMVRAYIKEDYPMVRAEFVQQEERSGLGHAIWLTRELHRDDDGLLIILGDTIIQADLREPLGSASTLIGVKEVEDPRRFGVVRLKNGGEVEELVEKPENPDTNLAIVGVYVIRHPARLYDALDALIAEDQRTKGEYQLTDALERMLEGGERIRTFPVEGWLDCGKPETLLETNQLLLDQAVRRAPQDFSERYPRAIIVPPVAIHPSATIERSVVGPYASVSSGATIRDSVVSNSILGKSAMATDVLLDGSIISDNARVKGARIRLNVGDSSEISFDQETFD